MSSYIKSIDNSYFLTYYFSNKSMDDILEISKELQEIFNVTVVASTHYNCLIVFSDNVFQLRKIKEYLDKVWKEGVSESKNRK